MLLSSVTGEGGGGGGLETAAPAPASLSYPVHSAKQCSQSSEKFWTKETRFPFSQTIKRKERQLYFSWAGIGLAPLSCLHHLSLQPHHWSVL